MKATIVLIAAPIINEISGIFDESIFGFSNIENVRSSLLLFQTLLILPLPLV